MEKFRIDADNFCWIDGSADNADDLCLHGHAIVCVGDEQLEFDATVSATALYLLKTLTEEHIIHKELQILTAKH